MASAYPGGLDSFAINKTNATATTTDHPDHHNDLADAVNKIEAELGITPSGGFTTVVARLAPIGVRVKRTTTQTISDNTQTSIQWDAEDFDTNAFHDNATNNTRLTVPAGLGGLYLVGVTVEMTAAAVNGVLAATIEHSADGRLNIDWRSWINSGSTPTHASTLILCQLDPTEWVTADVYHTGTSGSRDVTTNARAWMTLVAAS